MATTYKKINQKEDVKSVKTKLHEVIPITGSVVSGTYSDLNIKKYTHGMFQSVYDYPYLSSSANHIFDITVGVCQTGTQTVSASNANATEKYNIYAQMAQLLVGHDASGSIKKFDHLGAITSSAAQKMQSAMFIPLTRLLVKDEIEKESVNIVLGTGSYAAPFGGTVTLSDLNAKTAYKTNSPAGDYGILYSGSVATDAGAAGLVFYQAGIAVIEMSSSGNYTLLGTANEFMTGKTNDESFHSGTIDQLGDALRHRVKSIDFRNTTELNSTVYFCRANHNEFNYSSNPTYTSGSKMRVKSEQSDAPVSYITTVGLYSSDNVLLATAKLSEPLKKSPNNDFTIRVRLDY
jgi:hypothetical protein